MSHPDVHELEAQLEALAAEGEEKVAEIGLRYAQLKGLQSEVNVAVGATARLLLASMEDEGMKGMDLGPAKISISQRRCIGISEGETADEHLMHMENARAWTEKYNPTQPNITTTNLKATLEAYLVAEGGDAPLPEFLRQEDVPSLSVRRTKK